LLFGPVERGKISLRGLTPHSPADLAGAIFCLFLQNRDSLLVNCSDLLGL